MINVLFGFKYTFVIWWVTIDQCLLWRVKYLVSDLYKSCIITRGWLYNTSFYEKYFLCLGRLLRYNILSNNMENMFLWYCKYELRDKSLSVTFNCMRHSNAIWRHRCGSFDIDSDKRFLSDGNMSLPKLMWTSHQCGPVAFVGNEFDIECPNL